MNPAEAIREATGGICADVAFECAGGSPKQGLAGSQALEQTIDSVRARGKLVGTSWFGEPVQMNINKGRECSLRYLLPDISTFEHLEHAVRLVASGPVRIRPTSTHGLTGIESVQSIRNHGNNEKYKAINPMQVVL